MFSSLAKYAAAPSAPEQQPVASGGGFSYVNGKRIHSYIAGGTLKVILEGDITVTGDGTIGGNGPGTHTFTPGDYAVVVNSGIVTAEYEYTNLLQTSTGGTITTANGWRIHTLADGDTFTPSGEGLIDYFVLAGGGGCAQIISAYYAGGGAAGGLRTNENTLDLLVTTSPLAVTVGLGGAENTKGSDSALGSINATGGGRGKPRRTDNDPDAHGGSGGGASGDATDPNQYDGGIGNQGGYSPPEGYDGGDTTSGPAAGGGGGGATGPGGDAGGPSNGTGGTGGTGYESDFDGTLRTYACGGPGRRGGNSPVDGATPSGYDNSPGTGTGGYAHGPNSGSSGKVMTRYPIAASALTPVGQGVGTIISDLNLREANVFDGITSQNRSNSGGKSSGDRSFAWVGKDWGAGNEKTIGKYVAYGSTDHGFEQGQTANITFTLQGSNTGAWTGEQVDLHQTTIANAAGLVVTVDTGIAIMPFRYHRLHWTGNSGTADQIIAELEFSEYI